MAEEMLTLTKEITMKESLEDALGIVLKDYLERRLADCKEEIKRYEAKYGMSFEEFEKRIRDKRFNEELEKKYGTIQVENDYFEWGGAVTDLQYLKEKLGNLNR